MQAIVKPAGSHDEQLDALLEQLRPLVQTVVEAREYYMKRAKWPKQAFRFCGLSVIILSLSIPFIAALKFDYKDLLLSAFAVLIAIISSLGSFYKWEHTWKSYRQSESALGHLLSIWDFRVVEARQEPDRDKAREMIITATRQLLEETNKVTSTETQEFFSRVEWPKNEKK